jgi:N-acetylglucosamine transport system permease protein
MTAFRSSQFSYATAQGVVFALVTLAYTGLVFGVFRMINGPQEKGLAAS